MDTRGRSRRDLLLTGSTALAAMAFLRFERFVGAAPLEPGEEVIPWLDRPAEVPPPARDIIGRQLAWEELDAWITPNDRFFTIKHFGQPAVDAGGWRLQVGGLVARPLSLTLDELRARPHREVTATLECSGNHGLPFFDGGIGNAAWAGTPLAPLLEEAGVLEQGREVVFYGRDVGKQKVRDLELTAPFARSLSVAEAMDPEILLCYEMNGEPLPPAHGAPVRLLMPGWYGVASVKWLERIEVIDTRFAGHFMARDYVTIREERRDGQAVWVETTVGRALLKSAPARVTRKEGAYRVAGAAWGGSVAAVEVQVDGGAWQPATLGEGAGSEFGWVFWSLDWGTPAPGEHAITSRAIDAAGNVQPAMDDPRIAGKRTYWESNGQITRRVRVT